MVVVYICTSARGPSNPSYYYHYYEPTNSSNNKSVQFHFNGQMKCQCLFTATDTC